MSVDLAHLSSLSIGSTPISIRPRPKTLYNDPPPSSMSISFRTNRVSLLKLLIDDTATLQGGSPSSTMTIRKPANASPRVPIFVDATLRRRSSRLSRWLSELQASAPPDVLQDLADVDPVGTRSNAYLAYPHLKALRLNLDDGDSLYDYVVVDEDIALECPPEDAPHDQPSHESTPTDIATPRSTVRLINPSQSLRHFHLSRRSVSPSPRTTAPQSPSRHPKFHRTSRGDLTSVTSGLSYHSRSTSLQTSLPRNASQIYSAPRASSWRWRPSVLGHFSSASIPDTDVRISPGDSFTDRSRSRPSISSSNTCSSITTPTTMSMHENGESPVPSTPPSKTSSLFGSLRVLSQAGGMVSQPLFKSDNSSPSLRPQYPASAPHLPERQTMPSSSPKGETGRLSFTFKRRDHSGGLNQIFVEEPDDSQPHVLFAGKTGGPRLSLSSLGSPTRHSRKKKLVVSGIPLNDTRRLDAIQRWCQSFGEVDQITRMPNGDLHINFQKAEVADTVCRVRAKVNIVGAGSVHLSWVTGNKRT
ncbi:hypothetical protein L210DRAFT_2715474 [Boletus edulis BED1]|uniref:RRM domain-containing protein n=1 Tax=Boletus edulis BED1 TaxID=1328754 RepID=A0AAD4BL45_BOLED|nr:hypothetical protein L210DRAFT_2715474 [Boletus edulis BED1]